MSRALSWQGIRFDSDGVISSVVCYRSDSDGVITNGRRRLAGGKCNGDIRGNVNAGEKDEKTGEPTVDSCKISVGDAQYKVSGNVSQNSLITSVNF